MIIKSTNSIGTNKMNKKIHEECIVHEHIEKCLGRIKHEADNIEGSLMSLGNRISALEPIVVHNTKEIDSMRKMQIATLLAGLTSTIGVISALVIYIFQQG